jgi:hypothetical protein
MLDTVTLGVPEAFDKLGQKAAWSMSRDHLLIIVGSSPR